MNLKCPICSDLFTPYAEIFGTQCGHLFHYHCLVQWIQRSKTCPQCRAKATEKSLHKVYLNLEENVESTDASVLLNKLENLQFQINLRDKDVKNVKEKYQTIKKQNVGLRDEVKLQEDRSRQLESAIHALKDQVGVFKNRSKECGRLEEEVKSLKSRLQDMEDVKTVLSGNREQVNDMLRHNHDPQSLSLMVITLKKELLDSDKRRKQVQQRLAETQNESQRYKQELALISKRNGKLQLELECHKNCEMERKYLKKKISELNLRVETAITPRPTNTSIERAITESPAPFPKLIPVKEVIKDSPTVEERVQAIKDSDSPYLNIKSCSSSLTHIINSDQTAKPSVKYSIFKTSPKLTNMGNVRNSSHISYDGLGGHAKDDDFPVRLLNRSLKRSKSATVTSAKFRKLAPGSQKTLNEFLKDND